MGCTLRYSAWQTSQDILCNAASLSRPPHTAGIDEEPAESACGLNGSFLLSLHQNGRDPPPRDVCTTHCKPFQHAVSKLYPCLRGSPPLLDICVQDEGAQNQEADSRFFSFFMKVPPHL